MSFLSNFFGGGKSKQSPSTVWGPQGNALQDLYAQGATGAFQAQQFNQGAFPGLYNTAQQGYNQLGMLGQIGNPFVQGQIESLATNLGNFWGNQILPGLRGNLTGAGQSAGGPGSRFNPLALARGQDLATAFSTGASDLLSRSSQQAIQANSLLPGYGAFMQGMPITNFMGPQTQLANIYGTGPTVLGGGASSRGPGLGFSMLSGFAQGFGQGLGGQWGG